MLANAEPVRRSERAEHLQKIFQPGSSISSYLDIGCGNGQITEEIGQIYHIPFVYGADVYSPEQFELSSVHYAQIQNDHLPYPDDSMELITCFMSIHHFTDFHKMISEIIRVLKPFGWFFFREHHVPATDLKLRARLDKLHEFHLENGPIHYWDRTELHQTLIEREFIHLADSDYSPHINNPQAIYHSLYVHPKNNV